MIIIWSKNVSKICYAMSIQALFKNVLKIRWIRSVEYDIIQDLTKKKKKLFHGKGLIIVYLYM